MLRPRPTFLENPRRRRFAAALALVALTVLGLALLTRAAAALGARLFMPTRGAQWIWAERARRTQSPSAFYAARDFVVDELPERARLLVQGEEQYVLSLNGKRVGAGGYRTGAGLDVYEVGALLRPGGNRLLAELRSAHGAGAFLLSLEDGTTGEPLVRTDESWLTFDRHHAGLLRGWLPIGHYGLGPPGEPAYCWGFPPMGRWGRLEPGRPRPLFADLAPGAAMPGLRRLRPGAQHLPGGLRVVYDWGREVTGYLAFEFPPADEPRTALLYTGTAPPRPRRDGSAAAVLLLPGRREWLDAIPRRFRYAMVVGIEEPLAARVYVLDPRLDSRAVASLLDGKKERGVLGIEPPPLRTPVEDEIWRELQSIPGVAGGEEL